MFWLLKQRDFQEQIFTTYVERQLWFRWERFHHQSKIFDIVRFQALSYHIFYKHWKWWDHQLIRRCWNLLKSSILFMEVISFVRNSCKSKKSKSDSCRKNNDVMSYNWIKLEKTEIFVDFALLLFLVTQIWWRSWDFMKNIDII